MLIYIPVQNELYLPIPESGESCLRIGMTSLGMLQLAWMVETGGRGGSKYEVCIKSKTEDIKVTFI